MLHITAPEIIYLITESLYLLAIFSHFFYLLSLGTPVCSLYSRVWFSDARHKWYHTVFVFFCLTHFRQCDPLKVHPHCHKWQDLLLLYD